MSVKEIGTALHNQLNRRWRFAVVIAFPLGMAFYMLGASRTCAAYGTKEILVLGAQGLIMSVFLGIIAGAVIGAILHIPDFFRDAVRRIGDEVNYWRDCRKCHIPRERDWRRLGLRFCVGCFAIILIGFLMWGFGHLTRLIAC